MMLDADRRLSLLFFVTELGRGGAETQLKRVAACLSHRGHRVGIVSLMAPVGYVAELEEAGVSVLSLAMRRGRPSLGALRRARRTVSREAPDVVCGFLYHATLLAVASSLGRPLVSSIRDPSFGGRARLRLCSLLSRAGFIDAVVANNRTVARALVRSGAFASPSVHYIPNGLELPANALGDGDRRALRASIGIGPKEFLWLHVGNFQPPKDHPNLLRAFELVVAKRPDARLRMVGLGEAPGPIATMLARWAEDEQALHIGERHDVPALMQSADGVVLSSSSEGLPNVLMESLAVGTPVVSTDVGGVREIVSAGQSGVLVEARNHEALAQGMLALMGEPSDVRMRMGQKGRQRILETYDLDRVVDEWEALFSGLARHGAVTGESSSKSTST